MVRRTVRVLFPRPRTPGRWLWAGGCLAYVAVVSVLCLVSGRFDYTWDGEGGASVAGVVPVLATFPTGLLAFQIPENVDTESAYQASVVAFYLAVWCAGAFQAWVVWRGGVAVAEGIAPTRPASTPAPDPSKG